MDEMKDFNEAIAQLTSQLQTAIRTVPLIVRLPIIEMLMKTLEQEQNIAQNDFNKYMLDMLTNKHEEKEDYSDLFDIFDMFKDSEGKKKKK